jgi:hypothetical protein
MGLTVRTYELQVPARNIQKSLFSFPRRSCANNGPELAGCSKKASRIIATSMKFY